MTTFDKRTHAYESKLAHDEELEFKVIARRNKLLGLWVANRLHLVENDAEKYALSLVESYVDKASDEHLIERILVDLNKENANVEREEVEDQLERFLDLAQDQVLHN